MYNRFLCFPTIHQVRENYLESIENVIEVDQETIKESNASTR